MNMLPNLSHRPDPVRPSRPTLATLLALDTADACGRAELRRLRRHAVIPLALVGGLLGVWAGTAPLSGAIVASGKLKVELDHKIVQHKEGGIVRGIHVRDGDVVQAGQTLLVVGDVRNDADLALLTDQLDAERIRNRRAQAEATLAGALESPPDVDARSGDHLARETALFEARRRTLDEHVAALDAQLRDASAQAVALERQIEATQRSAELATEERAITEKLAADGFVDRARLLQTQREEADYAGRLAEGESDLALARQHAGGLRAEIAQTRNQYQQQATDEARESAARIREIEERLRPFRDQADRQSVRAPADGKIMSLRVAAIGEVIGPGEPILEIVPTQEKLVVEAHIRPQDIDHVLEGSMTEVRFSAFDARRTPSLPGRVARVSADRVTVPESGLAWYIAEVEIDADALALHPDIRLRAGMPAELFIATPERTLFQYLAKPLNAFASRAMREP
jgi:membrane fusion protein, type I secretion system